jgi:hypothetical protein
MAKDITTTNPNTTLRFIVGTRTLLTVATQESKGITIKMVETTIRIVSGALKINNYLFLILLPQLTKIPTRTMLMVKVNVMLLPQNL